MSVSCCPSSPPGIKLSPTRECREEFLSKGGSNHMRIGCFHLHDPVPELHEPYALASLSPWIDVNGVGSLVLKELESRLDATELAVLSRPGRFTTTRGTARLSISRTAFATCPYPRRTSTTPRGRDGTISSCSVFWSLMPLPNSTSIR